VRTLFVSYRVTDLERSLRFYTALGYACWAGSRRARGAAW
jgi:predicted lactoylglutathione lyase